MLYTKLSRNSQTDFTDIILVGRKKSHLLIYYVLISIVVQTVIRCPFRLFNNYCFILKLFILSGPNMILTKILNYIQAPNIHKLLGNIYFQEKKF